MSVSPEVTSRGVNRAVMDQLIDLYRGSLLGNKSPAYDGRKNLYTAGPLPFESKEFVIRLVNRDEQTNSVRFVFKLLQCPYFVICSFFISFFKFILVLAFVSLLYTLFT